MLGMATAGAGATATVGAVSGGAVLGGPALSTGLGETLAGAADALLPPGEPVPSGAASCECSALGGWACA